MPNKRQNYSDAQQTALVAQVNRICTLCAQALFYKKGKKTFKNYELAHIYPLNPTAEELSLLKEEKKLSDDFNDENNIIPLCKDCHGKFDNPRTVEEYRHLYFVKEKLVKRTAQEEIWKEYNIENEISKVISALYASGDSDAKSEIEFDPKAVDEKLNDSINRLTKRKIKTHVSDYYIFIRDTFAELGQNNIDLSDTISSQIKTYYLKQNRMGLSQQEIYDNIVSWLNAKVRPETSDATEIVASFFVQNCEVFS